MMHSDAMSSSSTLSSSLPPSFNFCEYMEEQAPISASSLETISPRMQFFPNDHQPLSCTARSFLASNQSLYKEHFSSKTSGNHPQPPTTNESFRDQPATDLATNFQSYDISNDIPDCSYFPFFVDPKLEQNIFDLPSDCDLQNYGVSLLDFLHKTFETPTSNEKSNEVNRSIETPVKTSDGCFTEDPTRTFNGSLLKKISSCPRTAMNADDQRSHSNTNKQDSCKPFPKPVSAVTMRQEPIVAQRACSRPVDKPVPQFARSFDVGLALNNRITKPSSANKPVKSNINLVSAGQVFNKHLQQHLYNQSGGGSNLTGTKIVTAGPEIQIPLKLDAKNLTAYTSYVNYQNADAFGDGSQNLLDPIDHLITSNNARGLTLFQEKENILKNHGMASGMNPIQTQFYQEVPPRPNARLPPYESHDQMTESEWSKQFLSNHISEEMKRQGNRERPKLLPQRVFNPPRGAHPETSHFVASGQNYQHLGCILDGRDENGYKTSCFCAEHCFPSEESNSAGQFEAFGHSGRSLRHLQLNGASNLQATYDLDRLLAGQQKLRLQQHQKLHQQQSMLQQQLFIHHQQQQQQQPQRHYLPLSMEPLCNHPECRENLRKLQKYNEHLGRFFDSEEVLDGNTDSNKSSDVQFMIRPHNHDELNQHLHNQMLHRQFQLMKAHQQQRVRNETLSKANSTGSQRCASANGRIIEDVNDMNLDEVKDRSKNLNIKINSKSSSHHHNDNKTEPEKQHDEGNGETTGEVCATKYTSNVVGNEETFLITSPIPLRKNRSAATSKTPDKPLTSSECGRVRYYPARAFKFYMEQHVEKVMQYYEDRRKRRQQLEKEMNDMEMLPCDRTEFRNLLAIKESNHLRLRRTKMDQSAFEKLANLGGGAFGNVFLVRKRDSGNLYAMKCMRKKDVWNKKQIAHVKAERDILAEADNRWVVKLYFSFQDADYLYLVMGYIPGGDLMGLLMKKGIFEHELAQFYIAELVLAIESVHKLGFIHRDIKPDNILINRNGHIKLTDFGLCTGFHWTHDSDYYREDKSTSPNSRLRRFEQMRDRSAGVKDGEEGLRRKIAKSLVGTPNYIAPEVLLQSGYTSCCDWWSVGVILYEMRFGQPPFRADTPLETQRKVINWKTTLRYPEMEPKVSRETIDFISRLCCGPESRLGSREGGAREIKSHPFFTGINFETLHSIEAPYIPQLQGSTDLSHFDAAKPLLQKPEQTSHSYFRGGVGCKYERCPSSSPSSSPRHNRLRYNRNFYEDDHNAHTLAKKAPLPPSYRNKPPRRSDSADSLYHSNGIGISSATGRRHRSPGGGWGSRNGGNDYGAEGSGGEESFTKHDFFDFTFRRFFDNESEPAS